MKKKKKRLLPALLTAAAAAVLLAVIFCVGCNAVMKTAYGKKIDTSPDGKKYDCILILGAKVFDDGGVSAMLADRLDRGIELYFAGASDRIIVSGDHGSDGYDEVNTMKAYCVQRGVPSEAVFMDHAGFSTYDSVVRAKQVFLCESVLIVTQKYHLYRALYIADSTGLYAYGASAAQVRYAGQSKRDLREYAARVKDVVYVTLGKKPVYLGETVPITGSGDVTNDK